MKSTKAQEPDTLKTTPEDRARLREWLGPAPDELQPLHHVVGRLIDDIDTLERKLLAANQVAADAQRLHKQLTDALAKHGGLDKLRAIAEEHRACRAVGVHPALTNALDGWKERAEQAQATINDYEHVLLTCGMLPRAKTFHKEQAEHRASLAKAEQKT